MLNPILVSSFQRLQALFIYSMTSRAKGVTSGSVCDLPVIYFTHS